MTYNLWHGDCLEQMNQIEDASIDLIVTSPPYWNQKEYSFWPTYERYLADVELWLKECYRVLKQGRHCFWVIPDKLPWPPVENGTKERLYQPIYADTEQRAALTGFVCEFPIIWDKRGPDLTEQPWSKKMWGSYPYSVSIIHTPFTERICVWRKPGQHGLSQADRQDSKITSQQFNDWARDIWSIRIAPRGEHPAPFPDEIPLRILTLWGNKGDTVLDPFMGTGTTGKVCLKMNRQFIGIEKDLNYFNLANKQLKRVAEERWIITELENSLHNAKIGY